MSINCTKASNSDGPSGYTSDKNSSSITSDYDSTSTLGGTSSDSEYSDISNLEERVDFISQKQHILKRANEFLTTIKAIDAVNAREIANLDAQVADKHNDVWQRARQTMKEIDESRLFSKKFLCNKNKAHGVKRPAPCPVHPLISAKVVCRERVRCDESTRPPKTIVSLFPSKLLKVHWVAYALSYFAGHASSLDPSSQWRLRQNVHDTTGALVPPFSLLDSISLDEAISITRQPRLVAQAMPPFVVVFCNKAFLQVSGLDSARTLIDQPIEAILDLETDGLKTRKPLLSYLEGTLLERTAVRFTVTPVLMDHESQSMSHIMIEAHRSEDIVTEVSDPSSHSSVEVTTPTLGMIG